jgi:acetyl-CoA carboxylase biotin carboxyl carrier protein
VELKQIKELMASMERLKIKKITIKEKDGSEVHLEKEDARGPAPMMHEEYHPSRFAHSAPFEKAPSRPHHEEVTKEEKPVEKAGSFITSPMVGTFYKSSSPEDAAFVKAGDVVDENTVVCIIEAMKVMNEVKSGMKGTIAEVLVENGNPVEFGTKMFRIV